MTIIPALGRGKPDDHEFEAILSYTARPYLRKKKIVAIYTISLIDSMTNRCLLIVVNTVPVPGILSVS